MPQFMHLRILVPFEVFADKTDVSRIVADTRAGSYGLMPHRLDCVAALVAGIFTYQTPTEGTVNLAVDEGVMVKAGTDVWVSVRRAIGGASLAELRQSVKKDFLNIGQNERDARAAAAKMESGFLHRLQELHRE
jgi:F-type H+-transporting ATPase subunit epsilon